MFLGNINNNPIQIFNLSSLTKSEDILSATLHYHIGDLQQSNHRCTGPQTFGCHRQMRRTIVNFCVWSFASADNSTKTQGRRLLNVSTPYRDVSSWQWTDITHAINQAKRRSELIIGIDMGSPGHRPQKALLSDRSPYILVYANDSAISEPESVVSALHRHGGALAPGLHKLGMGALNGTAQHRARRSTNILLPLQNNELPGTKHPYRAPDTEEGSPSYQPPEDRLPAKRSRAKLRKQQQQVTLLQFDERTMKKARKRQWNEPRHCARRYLKVDFADIGWSEWIISPKYFDAYYCSGSCQFPMPKVRFF